MIARSLLNDGIIDQKAFDRINSSMARTMNVQILDYQKENKLFEELKMERKVQMNEIDKMTLNLKVGRENY